ncbi:MAG: hypothetical protein FRX49_05289 [Trebouxia sp. A1-2]|nr:MAG: hypothetical protein FRX49_05289 [Trebouxia sp. A1-2]
MLEHLTWAKPVVMEVKDDRNIALEAERQQVLNRESTDPVIILHSQPGFAVVTQASKPHSKAVQCGASISSVVVSTATSVALTRCFLVFFLPEAALSLVTASTAAATASAASAAAVAAEAASEPALDLVLAERFRLGVLGFTGELSAGWLSV